MFRILTAVGKEQRDAHDELFTKYGIEICKGKNGAT